MHNKTNSHYEWLREHLPTFLKRLNLPYPDDVGGLLSAHGDKGYSYRGNWNRAGIPFVHGMALFLLSYERPFSGEVRDTVAGWVPVDQWVIDNYERFRPLLPVEDLEHWNGRD